uniref:Uncharacterized protein n=1 Tax=Acrobeloides nanus TaxID=290746 RepID=A0A914CQF7_9BILA
MFQLEHRYFGTSAPTPDMNTTNLKWLTTELALADINAFIPAMNTKFNFTKPKWVAFGGSYPGTMAALLRVVYPNITNGNIASSAPLWAKVDFWEYAEKMEQAIQWESQVNKSNAACYNETKNAFSYIKTAVYTDAGRNELNSVFQPNVRLGANMSNIDLDSTNFLSGVFGIFQGIIQYTFDDRNKDTINVTGLNVANLCQYMVDTRYNYTQRLYNVYSWTAAWGGFNPVPFDNDYWNDISFWRETSFQSDAAAYRGWMWLSCNEFGWLQTTDNGYGIFQNLIPLSFYLRYCTDVFGPTINNDYIQKHVTSTSRKYGVPWRYNGTNVVLPNGSLDPWSTLGCNVSDDSVHRKVRTTVGGAHCVDMYPYTPNSTDSVEPNDVINTINLIKNETRYYGRPQESNLVTYSPEC